MSSTRLTIFTPIVSDAMEILSQEYTLSPLPLPGILAIFWSGKSALWKLNMQTRDLAAADLEAKLCHLRHE
ncbi:hypothetical protein V6N12_072339 [Hibiscus sabdariffa]|uniref:Uncharacterized protein n=1 Tax=Hibiscus sabdariffa TaxID=183260 RepID=A0ABR2FMI9_9ROSI